MMRRQILTSCLIAVLIATVGTPLASVLAQSGSQELYFRETGHTVRTPFLEFFTTTGNVARYGYPITDDFVDPQTKLVVQYFQKARLEWHPANPAPYKIQLGLLGDELGKHTPPIPVTSIPAASDPSCRYFSETGHTVCYLFLEYWEKGGGLDMFGYPIDEYIMEDGAIVQYFQRAKMVWQPAKAEGERIQLAPLGEIYYKTARLDASRLAPQAPVGGASDLDKTSLHAHASVLTGALPPTETQGAYVRVVDQLNNPVSGAAVTLVVHRPQGDQTFQLSPTDNQGVAMQFFEAGSAPAGTLITLEFLVSYPGLPSVQVPSSYMIWFY
jgi:hypothetical protein